MHDGVRGATRKGSLKIGYYSGHGWNRCWSGFEDKIFTFFYERGLEPQKAFEYNQLWPTAFN